MEQIRRTLSPSGTKSAHSTKRQRTSRDHAEYFGLANVGAVSFSRPTRTTPQQRSAYSHGHTMQPQVQFPSSYPQMPAPVSSFPVSNEPSPTHSRPASVSMSVAHPQAYPAGPPHHTDQPQWRRASSFSSPFNPYYPTPIASTTLHLLMLLVHMGILIVLGLLLSDLRQTTATFHTMSNNGTGSYLRVGLYSGGLGSINRPFYIGGVSNGTVPVVNMPGGNASISAAPTEPVF